MPDTEAIEAILVLVRFPITIRFTYTTNYSLMRRYDKRKALLFEADSRLCFQNSREKSHKKLLRTNTAIDLSF